MKNLLIYLAVFYTITLSSCEKSENLKDNCYQAKVISNVSGCGTVVQIVAGSPSLPNSTWIDFNGNKTQRSYATYLPTDYTTGKTVYLRVNQAIKTIHRFVPAICRHLPEYSLDINIVDKKCVIIESSTILSK